MCLRLGFSELWATLYGGCWAFMLGCAIADVCSALPSRGSKSARFFGTGCIIIHGYMGIATQITRIWIRMRVFYTCIGRRACLFCLPRSAAPLLVCSALPSQGREKDARLRHCWCARLCHRRGGRRMLGCAVAGVLGVAIADLCSAAPLLVCSALPS